MATAMAMEGLTAKATEMAIDGSTAMEGSMATSMAMILMAMEGSTEMAMSMEGSKVMATETVIDGPTAMEGSTAMEMAIDGSTVKEGSTATLTANNLTIWKGLTAMATAMEADRGLDDYGNGINNSVIGGGLMTFEPKLPDSMEHLEAFWYLPCPHICRTASLFHAQSFGVYFQSSGTRRYCPACSLSCMQGS